MAKKKSKLQKKLEDPTSRLWRNKADKAIRDLAYLKANGICAVCGSKDFINIHHICPRNILVYRHTIENMIALCPRDHKYSFIFSAHKNPIRFAMWLQEKDPARWSWLQKALDNLEEKSKQQPNYKEIYLSLKKELDELKNKDVESQVNTPPNELSNIG